MLVLKLYIFGNAVKYSEVKTAERSEGFLTSVLHGISKDYLDVYKHQDNILFTQ